LYKSKVVCFLCAQKGKGGMLRNETRKTNEGRKKKNGKLKKQGKNTKQTE